VPDTFLPNFCLNTSWEKIVQKHPSIFYTCLSQFRFVMGAGAYPICHRVTHTLDGPSVHKTCTLTPRVDLEWLNNLTCMFLEYLERTCKLHTETPQPGFKPVTLSLWGDGANHHTYLHYSAFFLLPIVRMMHVNWEKSLKVTNSLSMSFAFFISSATTTW